MKHSCIVVGAGIAGIIAARRLKKVGWEVRVLEKSKGFGGRMATRQIGEAVFDHGAQFFTVHSMFFRVLVESLQDEGVVKAWSRGFLNGDRILSLDGYLRFFGSQGMSAVARHLAEPLEISLQEEVTGIVPEGSHWQVSCKSGQRYQASALIVTPPLPQALQLVQQIPSFAFEEELEKRLKEVKYDPVIAVMATLDGPTGLPDPGAIASTDPMSPIAWLSDNHAKGISPVESVTILGTTHFSRQHWKIDRDEAGEKLWQAARPLLNADRIEMQTHGWRFGEPKQLLPDKFALLQQAPPLLLAGDAFGDVFNPIEGAALSGLEAAKQLTKLLE